MTGIRITDKPSRATVDKLVGIRTQGATETALIEVEDFAEQLLAGEIGDEIDAAKANIKPIYSLDRATTANVTLSGEQTIDGGLTSASKVLVKSNADQKQNGPYLTGSGAWTRLPEFDTGTELYAQQFFIKSGTNNGNKYFGLMNPLVPTVGVTNLVYDVVKQPDNAVPGALDALRSVGANIAADVTTDVAAASGDLTTITGSGVQITAFGTADDGVKREMIYAGSNTIVHNDTSLILLGGVDRVTQDGDTQTLRSLGSGNWIEISYSPSIGFEVSPTDDIKTLIAVGPGGDRYDLLDQTSGGGIDTGTVIEDAVVRWMDSSMLGWSATLRDLPITGLATFNIGANIVLGVGQSFMAASDNSARIQLTQWTGYALNGVTYNARMIGNADRHKSTGATYDQFGSVVLNPLVDTVVSDSTGSATVLSQSDVEAGNYTTSARGATPLPAAIITFESLWNRYRCQDVDLTRFDIAANVAKGEAGIEDITTGDSLLRLYDALTKAETATNTSEPLVTKFTLSGVMERHGQYDEQYVNTGFGVTPEEYKTLHRGYRADVLADAASKYGQSLPPVWIGTQVSGPYGYPHRLIAQAQLEMSLNKGFGAEDNDYFLATPDYPFPNFVNAEAPHPNAGDPHPTTMGMYMAADYQAWCRFFTQILGRNWFLTHMKKAYFHGRVVYVGFAAMVPPLQKKDVCVGTTMTNILVDGVSTCGFDVYDGAYIAVESVELLGDMTFKITCAAELTAPIVGVAKGDRPNWPDDLGSSNICDSQNLATLFQQVFEDGYTNIYAGTYDDTLDLEDITELLGKHDMANWAAAQRLTCEPLPADFIA